MRIAPISTNPIHTLKSPRNRVCKPELRTEIPQPQNDNVNFKGNTWKIIGAIAGTAAVVVVAPAVAAVGLAGIGTLAGAIAGSAIDEKKEDEDEDKKKRNQDSP